MACAPKLKRTRFAPSPTGPLHLGHALAALTAAGRADPGAFLLRMEDIDQSRCRASWEAQIYEDLHWLGLHWPEPVWRQSKRLGTYEIALNQLISRGLCYPCSCTRADIRAALSAPQEGAPLLGPDGVVYPGTCRHRDMSDAAQGDAIRLDMARAVACLTGDETFQETGPAHRGQYKLDQNWLINHCGDIVLSRRDMATSYHLAVVVDDAAQEITEVTRGEDLFEATFIHRLLQALLALPTPAYHHHQLVRDAAGKRLAKRDDARSLQFYRSSGRSPAEVRAMIGFCDGISES